MRYSIHIYRQNAHHSYLTQNEVYLFSNTVKEIIGGWHALAQEYLSMYGFYGVRMSLIDATVIAVIITFSEGVCELPTV